MESEMCGWIGAQLLVKAECVICCPPVAFEVSTDHSYMMQNKVPWIKSRRLHFAGFRHVNQKLDLSLRSGGSAASY